MLQECVVDFSGEGGISKCREMVWSSAGSNLSGNPHQASVDIGVELRTVDSLSGLDGFEIHVSGQAWCFLMRCVKW